MFPGVLALMYRSLRIDSRSLQVHLARLGLMVAIYIALNQVLKELGTVGAPGLGFLSRIIYLNLTFMSLLGISFFSTAISEEKEEQTLGLMLMAGISPLAILIGKSAGRISQALILIAIQYPFTLLAITLGGITSQQIDAVYLGLAAYLILLAGLGLLCSTIGSNNRTSAAYMMAGLAAYTLIPLLTSIIVANSGPRHSRTAWFNFTVDRIVSFSVFQQVDGILATMFDEPAISWQVVSNTTVGVICFGLAWALFGYGTRTPSSEGTTRGVVSTSGKNRSWLSPGRAWPNPFIWKDFHFVAGGIGMIPIRLLFCLGLWVITVVCNNYRAISAFQVFLSLAIVIDAGRVMAGSLSDELRAQTLSSIVMLPKSTILTIYSKLGGAILGWLPGGLIDLLVSMFTEEGWENFYALVSDREGFFVSSTFVLVPNLSLILASYMRWGAVLLAIAVSGGLLAIAEPIVGSMNGINGLIFGSCVYGFCVVCHVATYFRIRSLAAR